MRVFEWSRTIVLVVLFFPFICSGQDCDFSRKRAKKAKKHFTDQKVLKATVQRNLFGKFSHGATTNFVRTDKNNYYLSLVFIREFGKRIDIMDKDPVVMQFEDNSILTLYPDKTKLGKFTLPVTTETIDPYYTIREEQLKLISAQPIKHVKIYFTSDKVDEDKRGMDDLGTFFEYEILSTRYQSSLIEAANCILQE
ncbi:hypothetical protein [Ulvibacterium sp.]|uniref:hypothetical protein n=1 Tax=Ulvibacterium sp. TaxID=2665914 RepID=UPI003BAAD18A